MAKQDKKNSKNTLRLNEITELSKEQNKSLATTPLKHAKGVFEALARWRSKSFNTGFRI